MKTLKNDIDLDFIGGQGSLTKAEEKQLSDYFKSKKKKNKSAKIVQTGKLTPPTTF